MTRSRFSAFGLSVALAVQFSAATPAVVFGQPPAEDAVHRALDAGDYARAEGEARADVERTEALHGPESRESAGALDTLVATLLRNGRGADPQTAALARRALTLHERLSGGDLVDVTGAIHNLGAVLFAHGDFTSSVALHRRGLRLREASPANAVTPIAESMEDLAVALMGLEELGEARSLLEQARARREPNAGVDSAALARTLELLGTINRLSGDYAAALPPLDAALDIRRRLGWEHPATASILEAKGWALFLTGDIPQSHRAWDDALAMFQRTLRPGHPSIGIAQRALAIADAALGRLEDATRRRRAAVAAAEATLARCDPELKSAYNDLAIAVQFEGDYAEARRLFERELALIKECAGPEYRTVASDAYATTLYNQADLAAEIGDLQEAERLYRLAIDVWAKALGPSHPFVSSGLDALARTVASRRQFTRAQTLYERALAMRIRTLGPNHPRVAYTLTNIARNVAAAGNRNLALRNIARAIEIYDVAGSPDEPDNYASALVLRGSIELAIGRYADAHRTFSDALAVRERVFGASHPLAAEARAELAAVDFASGAYDDALTAALDAERVGRDHLTFTIRYLPERHALGYAAKRPRGLDLALSILAAGRRDAADRVLDSAVRSRGTILDELADRARVNTAADPELQALTGAMVAARARFATLMMRSLEGESVSRALIDEARTEKEASERPLAERSAGVRAELGRTRIGLFEIRQALPAGSVLISFVRYSRSLPPAAAGASVIHSPAYLGFVVSAASEAIEAVPLGDARRVDGLVAEWRRYVAAPSTVGGAGPADVDPGTRLRQAVWDPLAKYLHDASTVFIVPDGTLNLVNFAALPADRTRYLIETGRILHYLSTERDLVPVIANERGSGLLAVGGPTFGEAPVPGRRVARAADCGRFGAMAFEDLPGSRAEAQEIAGLWPQGAQLLTGRDATETAVKRAAAGRRIVHFATHGFFLGSDCQTRPAASRAVAGVVVSAPAAPDEDGTDNALLRAGLVLAGANRRLQAKSSEDDGILTAEEVAGMDLRGTEWAVLSACDTGIGEIRAGEGVFGLRRAFHIAGAATVIMSLWSVDDQAARRWMRSLYEARLIRQVSTAVAVRDATLDLLRERRARGQSLHPFYWAAFVAAGDWR